MRGTGKTVPCLEMAERTIQLVPAITGLPDRLAIQGIVAREFYTKDRRVVYVYLTEKTKLKLMAILICRFILCFR